MADYECRFGAQDWQLYSDMPGAEECASHLSEMLTSLVLDAKAKLRLNPLLAEKKLAEKIRDDMYEVMDRFSKFGSSDTEPQCVLVAELERAFGLDTYSLER